jgi:hypothetical protein
MIKKQSKSLIYQRFDADGNDAIPEENQPDDENDEQPSQINIRQALDPECLFILKKRSF